MDLGARLATVNQVFGTHLFAVLIGDDRAFGGTGICAQHDAVSEQAAYDCSSSACRFWKWKTTICEKVISAFE